MSTGMLPCRSMAEPLIKDLILVRILLCNWGMMNLVTFKQVTSFKAKSRLYKQQLSSSRTFLPHTNPVSPCKPFFTKSDFLPSKIGAGSRYVCEDKSHGLIVEVGKRSVERRL
jgi:hypothetical protein